MRRRLLLAALGLASLNTFASEADDPDEREFRALADGIVARMTATGRQEVRRLTYFYAGPYGWSTPEERLTITWDDNARIEYRVLSRHSSMLAAAALDAGLKDPEQVIVGNSRVWVQTDAEHCPAAMQAFDKLAANYAKQLDADRAPANIVRLDGGDAHVFLFGTRHDSSYGYTAFAGGQLMRGQVEELKRRIVECGNRPA